MQIDPDNKAIDGISTLVLFIALNVIYLLCCIPIVTIGAATAALFEVMWRFADEQRGHLLRGYFSALKGSWRSASIVAAATMLPMLLLAYVSVFWFALGIGLSALAGVITALGALYCGVAFLYGCALVARFENTARRTIRNAYLFPMAQPLLTLGVVLVLVVSAALMWIFHPALFLFATVGAAFGAYLMSRMFGLAFRHQEARANGQE
ncbi:YesL family protein [Curtobacterium ammoniigenes]|uniref:YesL family protein n=1 Tax=Curtobacterium ammoniigenes TaxID=395387 RepID=UPI000AF5BA43|nr:YesL family protein [Curtobacterium ammoniigenes]